MATVADVFAIPLEDLRRQVVEYLAPLIGGDTRGGRLAGRIWRRLLLNPNSCGGFAWFIGIKNLDDKVDTTPDNPDDVVPGEGGLTRKQLVDYTTTVIECLVGQHGPEALDALPVHLPLILAVREGDRLGRDVREMLWKFWLNYAPDLYRLLRREIFPDDAMQAVAQTANVWYGVGWAYLLGVPESDACAEMRWLTLDFFEVDNLADLVQDIQEGASHYTVERLEESGIDRKKLAAVQEIEDPVDAWEYIMQIPGLAQWFHDIALDQVNRWSSLSRKAMVRLFGLAPGRVRHLYKLLIWLFSTQQLIEAWQLQRLAAGYCDRKLLTRRQLLRHLLLPRASKLRRVLGLKGPKEKRLGGFPAGPSDLFSF